MYVHPTSQFRVLDGSRTGSRRAVLPAERTQPALPRQVAPAALPTDTDSAEVPDDGQLTPTALLRVAREVQAFEALLVRVQLAQADALASDGQASLAASGAVDEALARYEQLLYDLERERTRVSALAHDERRLEESLSITAHELATPLTSTGLSLDLAARRLTALRDQMSQGPQAHDELAGQLEGLAESLAQTKGGMKRLVRLVADLHDITRIRTGGLEILLAPCDLSEIVRAVVAERRQLAPQRTIQLDAPPVRAARVVADAGRLNQVVGNYLTNALKYSPSSAPVHVRVAVLRGWVYVVVRDKGPGLPPVEQARIWDRFYRAPGIKDVGGSVTTPGVGLGLHICKALIEQHGGQVGVRSAVGKGATFWFALPLRHDEGAPSARPAGDRPASHFPSPPATRLGEIPHVEWKAPRLDDQKWGV